MITITQDSSASTITIVISGAHYALASLSPQDVKNLLSAYLVQQQELLTAKNVRTLKLFLQTATDDQIAQLATVAALPGGGRNPTGPP